MGEKLGEAMIKRDVNHPCIVLWDNGNEGEWNTDLDAEFAKWAPQGRHVMHPWAFSQGIDTAHYKNYETMKASFASTNVYLPTEFLHALYDGGGGAGLDDYWEVMRTSPVSAGGFIWALVDEGVVRTDLNGRIDVHGNRAPDGLVGPHREREGSFNTVCEIWCPIQVRGDALPVLTIENRYDFTGLEQCRFDWTFARFPAPQEGGAGHAAVAQGTIAGPQVPPHANGKLELSLPADWRDADALFVTARNPEGRELWNWSWPLQTSVAQLAWVMKPSEGQVHVIDEDTRLKVTVGDLSLSFGKSDGLLSSVSFRAKPISFSSGPHFVASATQTVKQEQGKGKKAKSVSAMLELSGQSKLTRLTSRMDGASVVVEATYEGALQATEWNIQPNGWIKLSYTYTLDRLCDLAGVQFDYPEIQMKSVRWLCKGPCRVWKNRLKGTRWDVWQNAYNDAVPGEDWEYPEFKGYFGDWLWATFATTEGTVTFMTGAEHAYRGVHRPNEGPDPAKTKLYTPQIGLAILDAIPPIGTKFSDANQYGPQSQPDPAPGVCQRVMYLRFD